MRRTDEQIVALTARAMAEGICRAVYPVPHCCKMSPDGYLCTRPHSHDGDHVAHVTPEDAPIRVVDRWPS